MIGAAYDTRKSMGSYTLIAPAKINLFLGIVGSRPDGFHELVMVMQSIALHDRVTVTALDVSPSNPLENPCAQASGRIRVSCDNAAVPQDSTNLAYRAADLMYQQYADGLRPTRGQRATGHLDIQIQKHIPMGAGLAGGSANAAAVLVGIDLLWDLGLTQAELQGLAAQLGSDIPFCIGGGTALATGRGELIDPLPDLVGVWVVLAKYRELPVSTPWAYKAYREQFGMRYPQGAGAMADRQHALRSGPMLQAIAHRQLEQIGPLLYNDLERAVLPAYPQVQQLRDCFQTLDVLGTMMSGSGSTVFALVPSAAQAHRVRDQMRQLLPDPELELWVTQFSPTGIRLANAQD
jgi:4-diphosphocytidyl-2-C-methyl-D-erythritol kinase